MEKEHYTPGQIREMLDLSRSALRYYIRKGLLDVDKSDENGYHYFDQNNLSDLRDISYLRQMLGFGVKDVQDCFNAATPDDYSAVFVQKRNELAEEIAQKQAQMKRISEWEYYLNYLKNYPVSTQIVEFEPFVFAPAYLPTLDKVAFLCTSFYMDGEKPTFGSYGYCFGAPDQESVAGKESVYYRYSGGKYIYTMCKSERDMDDPALIQPSLEWAREHKIEVKGPILVDYFFRIKEQGKYCYYYAVTMPFEENASEIQVQQNDCGR